MQMKMELDPPCFQGEQAQYEADKLYYQMCDMEPEEFLSNVIPQWDYLVAEAKKRQHPIAKGLEDWQEH